MHPYVQKVLSIVLASQGYHLASVSLAEIVEAAVVVAAAAMLVVVEVTPL